MDYKQVKRKLITPFIRLLQIFKGSSFVTVLFLLMFYSVYSLSLLIRKLCIFIKPLTRKISLFINPLTNKLSFKPASEKLHSKVETFCDEYNVANKKVERFFFKFIPASDQNFSQFLFDEYDKSDAFERKLINLNCSINLALAEIDTCKFFIKSLLLASEKHTKYQKMLRETLVIVTKSFDETSFRKEAVKPIINFAILRLDKSFKELPK